MSLRHVGLRLTLTMVESVRWRRLRWRLRGAWLGPAFVVLCVIDAVVLARLPFQGEGGDLYGALIAAGFINLVAVILLAPLGGLLVRRARPDLPRLIARDYGGTAALLAVLGVLVAGGLAHRGELEAERADLAAVRVAVARWVEAEEPHFRAGLGAISTLRLEPEHYRACVFGPEELPICLFVNTDQSPAGVRRDPARDPNEALTP